YLISAVGWARASAIFFAHQGPPGLREQKPSAGGRDDAEPASGGHRIAAVRFKLADAVGAGFRGRLLGDPPARRDADSGRAVPYEPADRCCPRNGPGRRSPAAGGSWAPA